MPTLRPFLLTASACLLALSGCEPSEPSAAPDDAAPASDAEESASEGSEEGEASASFDPTLGGQLFDKWFKVEGVAAFTADSSTLPDGAGGEFANSGHDYRLKNFFGWDLRGAEGIYGADYQNKDTVLPVNLLTDSRDAAALAQWFTDGGEGLPAYGEVMSAEQINALAAYIVATREGELPKPDQIFALSKDAPKNYTLNEGADATNGISLVGDKCGGCHGSKGDNFLIDGNHTLGSFGRTKAYEGWFKVVNGHPGSPMGRQSTAAQEVLDIFAALCDRSAFPAEDAESDAPDGDPRCGAYLK